MVAAILSEAAVAVKAGTRPANCATSVNIPNMTTCRRIIAVAALLIFAGTTCAAETFDSKQDEKLAAELRKRYDKGDGDAALRIGNMLSQKRLPASIYGTPVDWYRKGCKLNDAPSCHNVGIAYQKGLYGLPRDPAEAAEHYLRAANRGFLNSMYNLAILHLESGLIASDPRDGLKWMLVAQRAATQCPDRNICRIVIEDRSGYKTRLEERLSSRERREAYKLAEDWRPTNPIF
jgi:hypothetical protein